ncbi:EF-hand domain-containing protein [Aliiroseovarius marinus]|uniref:EF-hand domain-containing protein n=1 Tax=Aliiroseovarius marinus TaxID=2500159 RepID=UPI00105FDF16|nr:EF-hand domain-containing protein [Aliiroseovarius marinus]
MKLNKKTAATAIALGLGAALTLTSTAAMAFGGKDGDRGPMGRKGGFMQMEFVDVDLDKNGQITVEDLQAAAKARFDTADANGDGALTLDELKAQAEKRMADRMAAKGDGKGDGKGKMFQKRMGWKLEDMLAKKDADGNGSLSFDEMSPDQAKLERMIDRFDTDDDNAISAAEFDAAQKEMFMRHGGKNRDRKG